MQNERFKGMQTREMQLSGIRVLNEDDRTVELSFSSETPIERWGAFEVLSHTKSAVQLNRILADLLPASFLYGIIQDKIH